MEPAKLAIVGATLAILFVGLSFGVSMFAYQNSPSTSTHTDDPLTRITTDRDLLELDLKVPESWSFALSNGSTLKLSDLSGKIILVDLMTTWCSVCVTQNLNLKTVYDNLAGPLVILSLSVDVSETVSMLSDYKSAKNLPWDHGLDSNSAFANYFNVISVPSLVLIDGSGYFRYFHVGLWSAASISDQVASMM